MGGYLSTRWNGHVRRRTIGRGTHALRARDVRELVRELDAASASGRFTGTADGTMRWPVGDCPGDALAAEWTLHAPDVRGRDTVTLWRPGTRETSVGYLIPLDRVPQPLGGVRWWLRCPACAARRGALYLTPATAERLAFRCRVCLRLTYVTQRCDPMDRLYQRARKLARRLDALDPMDWVEKPRGMHWTTYERWRAELDQVLSARDALFLAGAARILARITPGSRRRTTR